MNKKLHCDEPYMTLSMLNNNSIEIALSEEGCRFLIDELQELIKNREYIMDYDSNTGYDCGILSKNSFGLVLVRKDFN